MSWIWLIVLPNVTTEVHITYLTLELAVTITANVTLLALDSKKAYKYTHTSLEFFRHHPYTTTSKSASPAVQSCLVPAEMCNNHTG